MTIKKQLKDCSLIIGVITLFILAILAALAIEYVRGYPMPAPGRQIIDEVEMNDSKPEHSELCGYHANNNDEYDHIKWALGKAGK